MSEFDPRTDPHGYAYAFTNEHAPAYAREAVEDGDVTDVDTAAEWAHETADSMAAVIYTGQAVALYASGLFDNEDDELAAVSLQGEGMSALDRIDQAITALSYTWHERILVDAAENALEEAREEAALTGGGA